MLPIVLDPAKLMVGVAGEGASMARRLAMLDEAGVTAIAVSPAGDLPSGLDLLYVSGIDKAQAARLAAQARAQGALVNVEDEPELCDFHVPAVVRRGDLLLTASTSGRSPGLVKLIREWLASRFGAEWSAHLDKAAAHRGRWRAEGLAPSDISARTRALAVEEGWLEWPR